MKFKAVIFDLDDTLMWDERLSRQAMHETAARVAERSGESVEEIVESAKREAEDLWRAYAPVSRCDALGIVAFEGMWGDFCGEEDYLRQLQKWVPEFRTSIWRGVLEGRGLEDKEFAEELGEFFRNRRRELQETMPGAEEILRDLREAGIKVGMLTNGAPDLQREKIRVSGLEPLFDALVVSGEIGIGKPEVGIFENLLGRLEVRAVEALMVGNSLSRDVLGGKRAGMTTCWLALEGEDEPVGLVEADFTIGSLVELRRICLD